MNILRISVLFFLIITTSIAQNSFRVMSYNILNYPSKESSFRNPHLKNVVDGVKPDIIVVQEIESISGVSLFATEVLDSNFTAGAFINGNDTDNALFYKQELFEFVSNTPIRTALRDISELLLVHKSTSDTLIIYSVHLKASDGSINEQKRLAEVNKLREVTDNHSSNIQYMVVGDFNVYSSYEPAFQALLDRTNTGYFVDPIGKIGTWHNGSVYRGIHTQSTRTQNLSDGGSSGGLDDRFDMILVSQSIIDSGNITYKDRSYTSYGNDGNHFNRALNELPNAYVSNDMATSLYYSSDHLPVYADFVTEPITSVENLASFAYDFELFQNYPNPFNPTTTIKFRIPQTMRDQINYVNLTVYNSLGEKVEELYSGKGKPGNHEIIFDGANLSSGLYLYSLIINNRISTKKMFLIK